MKKIIVTADDYGMCEDVDLAIDAGIENGVIKSTNVLLNMGSLAAAATLRTRYPSLSIGVHFNVTTGAPLCRPEEIPSLVDEKGNFFSIVVFKKRYSKGLIAEEDLERELEAQYALFEKTCGKADYWNTHENSALHLKAFAVFARVAKRHGVEATRTFQRVYYDKINIGFKREVRELLVKHFFEWWFGRIRKEFRMPDARIVSFYKKRKHEGTYLPDALLRDKHEIIEVVLHPALRADNPLFGNISDERVDEYRFASDPKTRETYEARGISFVSFSAL